MYMLLGCCQRDCADLVSFPEFTGQMQPYEQLPVDADALALY